MMLTVLFVRRMRVEISMEPKKKYSLDVQNFSKNTDRESIRDVVLSSTRQHDALVEASTREHDEPSIIQLVVIFLLRVNMVIVLSRSGQRYITHETVWECVKPVWRSIRHIC